MVVGAVVEGEAEDHTLAEGGLEGGVEVEGAQQVDAVDLHLYGLPWLDRLEGLGDAEGRGDEAHGLAALVEADEVPARDPLAGGVEIALAEHALAEHEGPVVGEQSALAGQPVRVERRPDLLAVEPGALDLGVLERRVGPSVLDHDWFGHGPPC